MIYILYVAPLRVRELKRFLVFRFSLLITVAPLRVRELKQALENVLPEFYDVAPLRVRELKLNYLLIFIQPLLSHLYGCVN